MTYKHISILPLLQEISIAVVFNGQTSFFTSRFTVALHNDLGSSNGRGIHNAIAGIQAHQVGVEWMVYARMEHLLTISKYILGDALPIDPASPTAVSGVAALRS